MIKSIVKKIIAHSNLYKVSRNRFVFLFHDIALFSETHFSEEYSILPEKFYQIIKFITQRFEVLSIDELISGKTEVKNKPLAAIMFDDGFYSVFKIAFPFLKEKNIPFAISINKKAACQNRLWFTDLAMNKRNNDFWEHIRNVLNIGDAELSQIKKMTIVDFFTHYSNIVIAWDLINEKQVNNGGKIFCDRSDLKQMLDSGIVTINSHSTNHYMLSKCTDIQIYNEINVNKAFIEEIAGITDRYFTLPFGKPYSYDNRVTNVCLQLGYKYIFTTNTEYFNNNDLKGIPFFIPRIGINNGPISEMKFNINMSIIRNALNKQV